MVLSGPPSPNQSSVVIPQPRLGETHGKTPMSPVEGFPFQGQEQHKQHKPGGDLHLGVTQEPGFPWHSLTYTEATGKGKASLIIPTNSAGKKTIWNENTTSTKGERPWDQHKGSWRHTLLPGGNGIRDGGLGMGDWGSRIKDQGLRIRDWGSRIKDQELGIQDQGSGIGD